MSTVKICDICQLQKKTPFVVTEGDGRVFDICSVPCLAAHTKAKGRTK